MKPQPSVFDLEQFRNLAAAEPIRNFLSTSGLTKTPGLNLYDSAKLQAGRQQHWDTIAQAADADRETYKQFLRGLANMSGAKRGPQFEGAIDAASHNVAKIAPYAMTFAPDLWDRLHGNRGSAAALASSVHQIYPERSALENSAFAQQVYKNLYGPGGTGAGGLSAGDIGRTYQAMHSQGLMGRKGGLDAQQASNRLFHGGTAIRSFIDTARDFPKSAAEEGGPSAANSAATPEAPSFVGGAAKLVGGGLAARSLGYSGLARVLGAQHFQHGTSDQAAASIRANGIQPSYGGSSTGSSAAVGSARFMRNSRGHVHVATGPVGRAVARFHAMLSQRNNQPGMGTVIKGYMPYDTFRQNFHVDPDWDAGSIAQRSTSAVPAKSIVQGGPLSRLRTLVANRASSVPAYIRANPGRVGLGALTLGAAGWLGSKALSGGRQVVNSLVGQPQPQVQTANPATTSAAAAPSVKSAGSRPWLDDNEKRTLASSAMLGGGLLGSLLIPGLLSDRATNQLKELPRIKTPAATKMLDRAGLHKDTMFIVNKDVDNPAFAAGGGLASGLAEFAPALAKKLRADPGLADRADRAGAVLTGPDYIAAGPLLHEAGHGVIHQKPRFNLSRINQTYLRPVGDALSPIPHLLAGIHGYRTGNAAQSALLGSASGALLGLPGLVSESQATTIAKKRLAEEIPDAVERKKHEKALRGAMSTYLYGALLRPAATGLLGAGAGRLFNEDLAKTASPSLVSRIFGKKLPDPPQPKQEPTTTIAKKGSGPVKEAAETDQLLPPVPGPSASTSAMGYGAAAAGLGAGLAAGSRPVARTAFNLVDKHLPFDSGLANRVESYRRGMAAAGNDASKLLSEYIRGGHDILSNNAFRGVPGLETAKNIHQNPVMKALAGDQNLWKTKQQHFSEFAASPVRGLSQIVRELHGDKAEDFVSPRFKPQYRSVEAEIARAAKLRKVDPKLWYQDATLKARFQPQFDSIDAAKRKVLAGLGRNAAVPDAAPKLLHNELWRTVRRFSPALSAEIAAAGVKSPADLAKLPPATQNKIVQLFAEKSEVGQHTSRLFRHAWREAAPFYNRMADRALPAIRWSDRLRRVLPRIVRHAPAVATGSAIGAGVLGAGWLAGRGNDAKAHAQRTLDWRKGIVDQAREAALSDQAALQSLRKPGVLTRMGLV